MINNCILIIIIETMFLSSGKGNVVFKLVQDFGRLQNLTSITACLLTPASAENTVLWGALVSNLTKIW